uniref:exocrine gland-secreted peptide 1-like n=1 Tax=Arvicanthis niloticus TaxID=61156 RepID=UPI001486DEFF|nr:exocrine gland-secreted peptide 1-like [Arvicanthis niloticus]
MAALPVILFLITLLLTAMHTEQRVLTETQEDSTASYNQKTNHKAVLDKTDYQGDGNIQDHEKIFSASKKDQTLFEDLTSANQHELNPSKDMMAQSNCFTQKHQVDPVNFNHIDIRLQGIRVRHQGDNFKHKPILDLDEALRSVQKTLVSRKI